MWDSIKGLVLSPIAALTTLFRRPGYTMTVTLTLALGIGAVVAVFALIHAILLRTLPYPDAEALMLVRQKNAAATWNTSVVDFRGIEAFGTTFDSVAAMRPASALVGTGDRSEWRSARWITARFFDVIGVKPASGRLPLTDSDRPGANPAVVLGHAYAEQRFGARDPVGQSVLIDGTAFTVVGVMPPGVERMPLIKADFWPVMRLAEPERRGPFMLSTLVRLKDGVGVDAASKDLDRISQQLFSIWQQGAKDDSARLTPFPLHDIVVGDSAGFLWTAMSAVAVLLFIVLVNVANLLLMRMAQRNLEQRIRAAIGASRWRLAGTLIRENFVLSLLGGIGGILLAALLIGMFRSFGPALPRLDEVELDFTVLAFAGALVLGSACVLTLMPLLAGGLDVRTTDLQSRIQGSGRLGGRVRDGLVVVEFALALPLIIAAALLVDNLLRLQQVDPGFQTDHVLTMRVRLPEQGYADVPARLRLWERATSSFRSVAGVEAVGLAGTLPPACGCYNNFEVVGRPSPRGEEPQAPWVPVDAGFFQAGRLRLLEGRLFNASDTPDSAPVVIVSEAWSRRYLPGEQVIGRQLYEGGDRSNPVTIIGLVSDARFDGLENAGVTVFAPVSQGWGSQQLYVVARTSIDPLALAAPLQSSLRRLDPQLVPSEVGTLDRLVTDSLGQQRHWASVIAAFATSALCLAAMGVFAVLAYQVSQRQREIGIRQAIGADATNIMHLVLWRGLRCALLGLLAGSVIAVFLTRALEFLLTQIQRSDPGVWLGAWALLLMVAGIACWLPARRASRLDPLAALRHD